ncbi:MAG: ketopantoate reductase C-terminal domain-containing protein, partial [Gammaproteobacteria bacterium]|nr:ketopantoate reductase C-terminal domain-containing protein [Gammaproteobacteria bacterium]
DIMDGRPSELEQQTGAVVRLGEAAGVDTPLNRFIYYSLLPMERAARGRVRVREKNNDATPATEEPMQ